MGESFLIFRKKEVRKGKMGGWWDAQKAAFFPP